VAVARLAALAVCVLTACSNREHPPPEPKVGASGSASVHTRVPGPVADETNVRPSDYIGPAACGECHAAQLAAWTTSLHRVMNMKVDEAGAVIGDFRDVRVASRGGEALMQRDGSAYVMTTRDRERTVRYRLTRTIGHRRLQEYVGIEDGKTDEVRLPFGWWPRGGGWQPQNAFDPWLDEHYDAFAPVREPWAERCPWCHSTYPFAQRIARTSGERAVGHGFEQYFTSAPGSQRLDVAAQVTTGISCESCHLGGRAHAAGAAIQFLPKGATARAGAPPFPATFAEQRADARVVNTVCAQCHSGPSPRLADGTALRNSSEALDLAASQCVGLKCTDCHDPHRADGEPDELRAIATCKRCHESQSAPAHAGTEHATTSCLDCHMPRIVMGIDRYVRTHRISSPTNAQLIAEAAPNACNLCHLDRPIEWTIDELRRGWEVRIAPRLARYGRDSASVGDVWLASSSPAVRLVASHAYARSPLGAYALTDIRKGLDDQLPYVQVWTRLAVEAIMDRRR
jgi:hypothetical protein